MPRTVYRKGQTGILVTVLVLFSIVLFIGSLFWLSVTGPWGEGSIFGDDLFKPASMSDDTGDQTQIIVETEHAVNMSEAMDDLAKAGCVFTEYKGEYSARDTISLDYDVFKEEAIERKLVFTAMKSLDTPVLLITKNDKIYGWSP